MTDNPLDKLQEMVDKNPELVFDRVKNFFLLSENSAKNINKFVELIKNGYVPVIYSNHQSHADGVVLSIITSETISRTLPHGNLKGFLCPVAASMKSGDQHDAVQAGVFILLPLFEKKGFIMVSVVRGDDRIKYGMTGSNLQALERLMHAPRDKFGMAIFPEGTVQGGRKKEDGTTYGMQKVEEGGKLLLRCINFWKEQGRESVLLPVGIINSYKIFSPDSYDISKDTLAMLSGAKEIEQLANVVVGEPFVLQDIVQELKGSPDPKNQEHIDYLMKEVADLLPAEARGYYL